MIKKLEDALSDMFYYTLMYRNNLNEHKGKKDDGLSDKEKEENKKY